MSRIVWGRASSSNVQKVLWALDELGLDFERIDIGGPHGGRDREDFGALTPLRLVPVYQGEGLTLWESHAILRHLVRAHGGVLTAPGLAAAAFADQWMDFIQTTFQPAMSAVFSQCYRLPPAQREAAALERAVTALDAALDILEGRLTSVRWLGGSVFGLADIAAGAHMHRYQTLDFPRRERPALDAWIERIAARPGWQARVATSYEELRG